MHSCVWDASKWINCIQSRWLRPDHAFSDPYFYYLNMTNEFVFLISANWNVVSELVNIETNVFEIVFFGCTTWRDINFIFMILQCFELKDIYISIHFFKCFFFVFSFFSFASFWGFSPHSSKMFSENTGRLPHPKWCITHGPTPPLLLLLTPNSNDNKT